MSDKKTSIENAVERLTANYRRGRVVSDKERKTSASPCSNY